MTFEEELRGKRPVRGIINLDLGMFTSLGFRPKIWKMETPGEHTQIPGSPDDRVGEVILWTHSIIGVNSI